MSEGTEEKPAGATEDKPAEQEAAKSETDWKAEARKWEQRAKENTEAAKKLADIEEANKTEIQKAQERAAAAEQRATQAELTALKVRIAAEKGVPVEVLHGNDEAAITAAADKVLAWAESSKKPAPAVRSLKSGATSEDTSGMTGKQKAAAALRSLRNAD